MKPSSPLLHSGHNEIEVKFYPVDIDAMRRKLTECGATCTHPMRLMRRVVFNQDENPHLDVSYIRVRDEGDCVRVSTKEYADHAKGIEYQRELDITVSSFERAIALFEIAGLKKSHYQESKREQWKLGESEVCIDVWPHLTPYIEIESPSDEALRKAASTLGLRWEDHINAGALRIYMREYGWEKSEAKQYVKRLLFDEPLQKEH